jgi:regulation of enolase protein 1 (concanavalin A-like superfamily)
MHTLHGAGADIWGGADAFHFLHQLWEGDVEITARVVSVEKTDPWAKAGVMIRGSLTETSAHAIVAVTPEQGPTFIRRLQAGGVSKDEAHQAMRMVRQEGKIIFQQRGCAGVERATESLTASPTPRWIKLVRRGQVVKAFDSSDGLTWEWLGTESLSLPEKCYVGLAVSSHDAARLCRAVFEQVIVKRPQPQPLPETMAKIGNGDGLRGTYSSELDHTGASVERIDATVDFDWGMGAPAEGIGRNGFSVRWEGELEAQFTEPYALHVSGDDRARLWLNGELLLDEWYEHGEQVSSAVVNLEAGRRYALRLEYFENRGRAVVKLRWSSPSTPQQVIPQSQLYSRISDKDRDGLPDAWKVTHGLSPADPTDADALAAGGTRSNRQKYEAGFDPIAEPTRQGAWLSQDVGRVGQTGSAELVGATWTLKGSGADIWANADGFQFVYQLWRGDGEFVARLVSQENTDPWAKAGLMLRESLRADTRHALLAGTPEHGLIFLQRQRPGAGTTQTSAGGQGGGPWLKLVRRGDTVAAFSSADGQQWEWLGTEAMVLPAEVYVGLAVNSHDNSRLGAAVFDQVSFEPISPLSPTQAPRGSGDGLQAMYFDSARGNTLSRVDPTVDFDWDIDAPAAGIAADHFSVRWEGWLEAPADDLYALHVLSDDGARLWLDGQLLFDAWEDRGAAESTAKVTLRAGQRYALKLEYFEPLASHGHTPPLEMPRNPEGFRTHGGK